MWTYGEPESRPGRFSWLYVPLIRCALGLDDHGGMVEVVAGKLWPELRDHYSAEFTRTNVSADALPWQQGGYLDEKEQVRLLRGSLAGGESNIADAIEGKLEQFAARMQRVFQVRHAPAPRAAGDSKHSRPPHSPTGTNLRLSPARAPPPPPPLSPPRPDAAPDPDGVPRLSLADIAEHARLWQFVPHGCEDHWRTANRSRWQALLTAHAAGNVRERGYAVDAILALPSQCLVRTRGGVRRTRTAIRTRLNTVAAARTPIVHGSIPARSGTPHVYLGTERKFSELDAWKARVRRAVERGKAGKTKRCVDVLTQEGLAAWTDERIDAIRLKHPAATHAVPEIPPNAPLVIVDCGSLAKQIKKMATFTAAGPSGWTAELLLALLDDKVCMDGITLLVQLIANNQLDALSRDLLTSSLLHAIPKPNRDLRPLALGEFFVKAACKYCFDLDAGNFPAIFEPIQLAVCSPGGSERAILTMQAKTELDPEGYITIYVDSVNAYNSACRAMMLESVYSDSRLAHLWSAYAFCYSTPSQLLLRQHGTIIDSVLSAQGGRQGCVLAGLGYAHLFQPAYENCVQGLPNTTARAIMDDLAITGPPAEAFAAFAAYMADANARHVEVNASKTCVAQARGPISSTTRALAARHGIEQFIEGNADYVGGYVGVDDDAGRAFVSAKLAKQKAIARAIRDPDFPLHLALNVAKIHVLPRPVFYLRALPYRVTRAPLEDFDSELRTALLRRAELPTDLPPSALLSLHQPVGTSGVGLRLLDDICPAGKWSAAAAAAPDIQPFVDAAEAPLPCVADREAAHADLVAAGIVTADDSFNTYYDIMLDEDEKKSWGPYADGRLQFLPLDPSRITTFYMGERKIPSLQFVLSRRLASCKLDGFLDSADCSTADRIRLHSCRSKESGRWLRLHPLIAPLSDAHFRIALRLRLGLPPLRYNIPLPCPMCMKGVHRDGSPDPWHPLACSAVRRRMVTSRHDRAMELVCRYARSCSVIARIEPKDFKSVVPDSELFFAAATLLTDLTGVHSLAPSHLHDSPTPGQAMERRATHKCTHYNPHAEATGSTFAPLVMDAFGSMHKTFGEVLDRIAEEAGLAAFAPAPGLMTPDDFLCALSTQWQMDNARIVLEWQRMCRMRTHHVRE